MKNKILVIVIAFVLAGIIGLYFLFRVGTYGFSSPECSEREKELEVPEYLNGMTIKFEHPMVYVFDKDNKKRIREGFGCTESSRKAIGDIFSINVSMPNMVESFQNDGSRVENIAENETFKIVKRVYISCLPLACIDSGGAGDEYLVQNSKGEIWKLDPLMLKNYSKQKQWNAGYYDVNGERLGDVVLDTDFSCKISFLGEASDCGKLSDKQKQ